MAGFPDWQRTISWEFPPTPSDYISASGRFAVGSTPQALYTWGVGDTGLFIIQRLEARCMIYFTELNATRDPSVYVNLTRGLDAKSPLFAIDGAGVRFAAIAAGETDSPLISIGTQDTPILVNGSDGTTANVLELSLDRDNSTGVWLTGWFSLLMWKIA